MPQFRDLSIRTKLLLTLLGIGVASIGVIGWVGYSSAKRSLEEEAFGKLAGVQSNKANAVEDYVREIRDQVVTTSENDQTVQAMQDFRSAFRVLDERNAVPMGDETEAVQSYYEDEFVPRLEEGTGEEASAEAYVPEEGHIQYLQNKYIASNPNPVGEKDKLNRPDEGWEAYHVPHAEYHDDFRRFLHAFNYYDIFLVEPDDGHIVYSVYRWSTRDGVRRRRSTSGRACSTGRTGTAILPRRSGRPEKLEPAKRAASPILRRMVRRTGPRRRSSRRPLRTRAR